jgi:putative component of membrane protein insertase Oxa1/YidC/SpoIIIJ protein YidD
MGRIDRCHPIIQVGYAPPLEKAFVAGSHLPSLHFAAEEFVEKG